MVVPLPYPHLPSRLQFLFLFLSWCRCLVHGHPPEEKEVKNLFLDQRVMGRTLFAVLEQFFALFLLSCIPQRTPETA